MQSDSVNGSELGSWVGFGGIKSINLIQCGTAISDNNGTASYNAFYEYMHGNTNFGAYFPTDIYPGDTIYDYCSYSASNGGTSNFVVTDETHNFLGFSVTVNNIAGYYDGSTVECIDERPKNSSTKQLYNLLDYKQTNWNGQIYTNGNWQPLEYSFGYIICNTTGGNTGKTLSTPVIPMTDSYDFTDKFVAAS